MKMKRSHTAYVFRRLIMTALFLTLVILFFEHSAIPVQAEGRESFSAQLHYSSIKLCAGDTLETVAANYNTGDNLSDMEYIQELREINQLNGDKLYPGCYLTVLK